MSEERLIANPWPIIGHEPSVARLTTARDAGRIAHSYLISGPGRVGKKTLARAFAQTLLCMSDGAGPCGDCRACRLVERGQHPDFPVLDMAWQRDQFPDKKAARAISVDAVRRMNADLARRPHEGRWKLLLVPDVEELTVAASNAFLKTLEEPPSFVVILLTTRDPELLLPTIRSRCQQVPLRALPVEQVEQALQRHWGIAPERATLLARLSGGRIGWAIEAARDDTPLETRREALESLQTALAANRAERLLLAASLARRDDLEVMQIWAGWWRDLLLAQNDAARAIANVDRQEEIEQAAERYTVEQVKAFLRQLQHLLRVAQETNANKQLVWELLLLKLPHRNTR